MRHIVWIVNHNFPISNGGKSDIKRKRDNQEKSELLKVESEIKNLETGIEVAEKPISDGSSRLEMHLAKTHLDSVKLQADNALIQMGVQRRNKLNDELAILTKKRAKLRKQTELAVKSLQFAR